MTTTRATVPVLILVLAVLYWLFSPSIGDSTIQVGSASVRGRNQGTIVSLLNASLAPAVGNYDALDAPRGTAFSSPTSTPLVITGVILGGDGTSTSTTVTIGYGEARVTDSAAAPSSAVDLVSVTHVGDRLEELSIYARIPAGKIPWVRVTGSWSGTWPSPVTAIGVLTP